ncbi:MAG: hypothetical protein OXQ29_21020 [Rhodospirillaceae bacterium]|nr:hypothetical protein [Rhodospirillaceae bacterium]
MTGPAVFGLAGLRIPDALDARCPASAGSLPIGGPAIFETDHALAAPGIGPVFPAAGTKPHRSASLGASAMALAIFQASPLDISMGHWGTSPGQVKGENRRTGRRQRQSA